MAKARTAKEIESLIKKGKGVHAIGEGLYIDAGAKVARWLYIWTAGGKRRKLAIGTHRVMSLADAREKALELSKAVADGVDPAAVMSTDSEKARTFEDAAREYIAAHAPSLSNAKHAAQWRTTLLGGGRGPDYCRTLRPIPVAEITTTDVLAVLSPIWHEKPETANRIRGRIEMVLDAEAARGNRDGDNPARWRGKLQHLLGKRQKLSRGHHAAMGYSDMPDFLRRLQGQAGIGARALEFTILTAARSGEVRGATWAEIDTKARLWTVPGGRMKASKDHRVPLCGRAMAVLEHMRELSGEDGLIFPGAKDGKPMSDMSLSAVLRRMNLGEHTVHGFRSTFRDWAGEETAFPREVAEAALAHAVGDAVEQAYRRGDALQKRRDLMAAWERHCYPSDTGKVVPLRA